MKIINQLPSNPWAWMTIAIITIGGFIIAYRSMPQKVLKFYIINNELITSNKTILTKLDILYNGTPVNNLTVTKIVFWNNAFPTINAIDIVKASPLLISAKEGSLLDVSIINGQQSSNCITTTDIKDNKVSISFDYLDRKEGGIVQIIHTGNSYDISLSGKLKGGKIVMQKYSKITKSLLSMSVLVIPFIVWTIYLGKNISMDLLLWPFKPTLTGILAMLGVALIGATVFLLSSLRIFSYKFIPKNCKKISKPYSETENEESK